MHISPRINSFASRLSAEQILFTTKLKIPKEISFVSSSTFETKSIITELNVWELLISGSRHILKFSTDKNINALQKYLVYRYATLNTPYNLVRILRTLKFLMCSEAGLSSESLIQKLNKFSNSEYDGATEKFYPTLFILRQLVSIEYPGFEECEAEVEQLFRPAQNSFLIYQNIDNILSLADTSLIQNGLINAAHSLDELSIIDLKNICILGICYVTGARPVQLSKIAASDLKIDFGRDIKTAKYSLRLPLAKKSKKTKVNFVIIKLPEELGFLITNYINKINIKTDEQLFSSDNTVAMVNAAIRDALISFSDKETQTLFGMLELPPPPLTSMDFRHNIGHTLAMRGASEEEIAYILGHSSTVAARHYILATPELADIKARTLGINPVYQDIIAMMLTGDVSSHERWQGDIVAGMINNHPHFGIGGCGKTGKECPFTPVRSCYGCQDFHPFVDADHISVLKDVQQEIEALADVTDATGNGVFSAATVHEQTKFEVLSVIARCKLHKDVDDETDH